MEEVDLRTERQGGTAIGKENKQKEGISDGKRGRMADDGEWGIRGERYRGERSQNFCQCTSKSSRERLTLTISPNDRRNSPGSSTCSSTSIAQTTSNVSPASRSASADVCRYSRDPSSLAAGLGGRENQVRRRLPDDIAGGEGEYGRNGSREACRFAMAIFDSEASTPITSPPSRARLYNTKRHELLLAYSPANIHLGE